MFKNLEHKIKKLEDSLIDRLYCFSDDFFNDSAERKDVMDYQFVKYIISNTGVVYLVTKSGYESLLSVGYNQLKEFIGTVIMSARLTLEKFRNFLRRQSSAVENKTESSFFRILMNRNNKTTLFKEAFIDKQLNQAGKCNGLYSLINRIGINQDRSFNVKQGFKSACLNFISYPVIKMYEKIFIQILSG